MKKNILYLFFLSLFLFACSTIDSLKPFDEDAATVILQQMGTIKKNPDYKQEKK